MKKQKQKIIIQIFQEGKQTYTLVSVKTYVRNYYHAIDKEQSLLLEAFLTVYAMSLSIV